MADEEFDWLKSPSPTGVVTARFGETGGLWTNKHTGMDFASIPGSPVVAVQSGIVMKSSWENNFYGEVVKIRHTVAEGTLETWYAHLLRPTVESGTAVSRGEVIGLMGKSGNATGFHVHLEVRVNGTPVDPVDYLGTGVHPNPEGIGPQFGLDIPQIDFGNFGLRVGMFVGGVAALVVGTYGARKAGLL